MITVVKFDWIEPIRDAGPNFPVFTGSEPWNDQFDNLGYGSKNLYDCLGSFNLFIGIMEFEFLLVLLNWCGCCGCSKSCTKKLRMTAAVSGFLTLFLQGHFEILLALAVSGVPAPPPSAQDNVFQLAEMTSFDNFT